MINFNGEILKEEDVNLSFKNRGLKYGDSIFETIKVINGSKVVFWEDHYFRLMSSMRMLRMKIPMSFTLEYLENQILALVREKKYTSKTRVRFTVFRKEGGLYTPKTNQIDFLIEANEIEGEIKQEYKVDIFKDFYNYSGLLSTIKTNNKILNTLASIFAKENDLDNCILINENNLLKKNFKNKCKSFKIKDIEKITTFINSKNLKKIMIIGYVKLPSIDKINLSIKSKISFANTSGFSNAAKCPPSCIFHWTTL